MSLYPVVIPCTGFILCTRLFRQPYSGVNWETEKRKGIITPLAPLVHATQPRLIISITAAGAPGNPRKKNVGVVTNIINDIKDDASIRLILMDRVPKWVGGV